MALTLPYPSLVFVPLDKLTAEEMNQIVANYESIANQFPISSAQIGTGAIGTNQIANNAVTTAKLAWSGFGASNSTADGSVKVPIAQSEKKILYANINQFPAGSRFCVIASVTFEGTGDIAGAFINLRHGTQRSHDNNICTTWGRTVTNSWIFTKESSSSTVDLYSWKDNTTSLLATVMNIIVFRVG